MSVCAGISLDPSQRPFWLVHLYCTIMLRREHLVLMEGIMMIRAYEGSFLNGLKVPLKGGSPCKPKTKMSRENRQANALLHM